MSNDFPTLSEVAESNIRERFGCIPKLIDMGEREDDRDDAN